jgi:hypothetical protein
VEFDGFYKLEPIAIDILKGLVFREPKLNPVTGFVSSSITAITRTAIAEVCAVFSW